MTVNSMAVAAGFVDGRVVKEAFQSYRTTIATDESAQAGWRLTELAALELWLRRFFGAGLAGASA
jgi:hypothetical protein